MTLGAALAIGLLAHTIYAIASGAVDTLIPRKRRP